MNSETLLPSPGPLVPLMRTVWLQMLRRKDLYLLAFVMIVFGIGAIAARSLGSGTIELVLFVGSLGYTLSSGLAGALVILVASRLIPAEIESRTIYPVLAKPVSRAEFMAGRFVPAFLAGCIFYLACAALTFFITPRLTHQSLETLTQAVLLMLLSLGMLTAMMMAMSLVMPSSLATVIGFLVYFGGGAAMNALGQATRKTPWTFLVRIFPDFSPLDQMQRYVDGVEVMWPLEFGVLLGYGLGWTLLFGSLALWMFNRRAL